MWKNSLKVRAGIALLIFAISASSFAQEEVKIIPTGKDRALVYKSDTLPVMYIPEVNVYDASKYSYLKARRYRRMIYNVRKAYPYALLANSKLLLLDKQLAEIDSKKEQKDLLKNEEKKIMDEFEDELRKLTIKQGIILVKLIDRETGRSSYQVIKEIRGGVTAFFWQGIAKFFGNNLKAEYDSEGKDKIIEDILIATEQGFI